MLDAGLIVLASFISPFLKDREFIRHSIGTKRFIEIYVNTPIDVCEYRDPKGLYKKARNGEVKNFTGIDSHYEAPKDPDISINTANCSTKLITENLIKELKIRRIIV